MPHTHLSGLCGQVTRPLLHKVATSLEQVAAPIGGLDAVAVNVGQGEHADLPRRIGALGGPVAEAGAVGAYETEKIGAAIHGSGDVSLTSGRRIARGEKPGGEGWRRIERDGAVEDREQRGWMLRRGMQTRY